MNERNSLPLIIDMLFGVVQFERMVDGRTFLHELYRAARVGRDVADGQQAMRKLRTPDAVRQPRRVFRPKQGLGVRDCDQPRGIGIPVDTVHNHRRVRRDLYGKPLSLFIHIADIGK